MHLKINSPSFSLLFFGAPPPHPPLFFVHPLLIFLLLYFHTSAQWTVSLSFSPPVHAPALSSVNNFVNPTLRFVPAVNREAPWSQTIPLFPFTHMLRVLSFTPAHPLALPILFFPVSCAPLIAVLLSVEENYAARSFFFFFSFSHKCNLCGGQTADYDLRGFSRAMRGCERRLRFEALHTCATPRKVEAVNFLSSWNTTAACYVLHVKLAECL